MNDFFDPVYYKIYYSEIRDCVTVVCMQWFDEGDYFEQHFFKDKNGNILKFDNEDDAVQWLNNNVVEDKIDPQYKEQKQEEENEDEEKGFNQKKFMKTK